MNPQKAGGVAVRFSNLPFLRYDDCADGGSLSGRERAVEKKRARWAKGFVRSIRIVETIIFVLGCRRARNVIRSRVYQTEAQDKPLALGTTFT